MIMEKKEFRELLKSYHNNYSEINQDEVFALTKEAMNYIGDLDPTFRDNLVYPFINYVISQKMLNRDEIKEVLRMSLNNIAIQNNKFDDDVFTRSFSMLVIVTIIEYHRRHRLLSLEELKDVFVKVLKSYQNDFDVRGFIIKKGWAHGAAHGADALEQFALTDEADSAMLTQILSAVQRKISISYYGYIHNEDDRMARAIVAVLNRQKIDQNIVFEWLKHFILKKQNSYSYIIRRQNIRNFLSCLYFRLLNNENYQKYNKEIEKIINGNN